MNPRTNISEKKVLIIDIVHKAFVDILSGSGFVFTDGTQMTKVEINNIIEQFNGLIIRSRFELDNDLLTKATQLKFIARAGAGMENINVDFATSKGIACLNAPEGNRNAVGEHSLAMLLALFNKIAIVDSQVRKGIWKREENRGIELEGKTIGIIGCGNMGSAFAKTLSGFNVEVLVYDKYVKVDRKVNPNIRQVELLDIYNNANIISLHIPLTAETRYMVNHSFISNFKKEIYVINTARGKVIKTDDLVANIKDGKVLGACLDVIEYEGISFEQLIDEQLPESWQYLISSDKVLLSPHIAGWSFESYQKISEVLALKVLDIYNIKYENNIA